ncbi:phosphotransferase family protein [Nonomuraea cavernae]|uniref:phosphotransferase family protein n=1 Tax=Nonomuraea cavernae TaxID=2045107 RepID=UPI0033E19283
MDFQSIQRATGAFQEPLTAEEIVAVCRRAFGPGTRVVSVVELGNGMYNTTYRINLDEGRPVVLRVAPEPGRQFLSERELMRNEYASLPYLTSIAPLMPRVMAVDFTHEVIGRDWMIQSLLDGVPAPEGLPHHPRSSWPDFFRQIGAIARQVHAIRGPHFGRIAGPGHDTWSQALITALDQIAAALDSVGLDAADLRRVAGAAAERHAVLDEVTQPRMLAGDLWTVNIMLADATPAPTISGVLDLDRTWWGDPAADWTIRMALAKPGTERDAFWDAYGSLEDSPSARFRSRIYHARHIGEVRLECHRLGNVDGVRRSYEDLRTVLTDLH